MALPKTEFINIGDLRIAYNLVRGTNDAIVFIHGNSAGKDVFKGQMKALGDQGYTVLAVDLPGHGESTDSVSPEQDYNFPAFALLIKKILDAVEIKSPLVVGWSLGGHVVLEMAGRGFDMRGAMIFGTPPLGPGMADFEAAFIPSKAMAVTLKADRTEEDISTYLSGLYGTLSPVPAALHKLASRIDPSLAAHMGAHWASGEEGCHQKTVAAGWQNPICIIHGEQDVFASLDFIKNVKWGNLWRGGVQVMKGVGHAPFIEVPDKFNTVLSDFAQDVFKTK